MNATGTARAYRIVAVNIISNLGSKPSVDVEPSRVSKCHKDIIRWRCDDDPNWKVDYGEDSPFKDHTFDRNNDTSGPARDDARVKQYKYSVTAGGGTTDPGTIVDR